MPATDHKTINKGLQLLICSIAGATILLLLSLVQHTEPLPVAGEYFVSSIFRNQYTWLAVVSFFIAGFSASYFLRWNPLIVGIGLIAVFPVVAILEIFIYPTSHNLIPFEIIVFAFYALPGFIAALAGRFLANKKTSKKQQDNR